MEGDETEKRSSVCSDHFLKEDSVHSSEADQLREGAVKKKLNESVSDSMASCHVKVCRICFASDCKLYSMTSHKVLCKAYETITGLSIEDEHKLPLYVCAECSHQLLNCARFRSKSLRAHLILLEIVKNQDCITLESIQSSIGLQTSLSSSGIHNKTDQYDLDMKLLDNENIQNNEQTDTNIPLPDMKLLDNENIQNNEQTDTNIPLPDMKLLDNDNIQNNEQTNTNISLPKNVPDDDIMTENDVINKDISNEENKNGPIDNMPSFMPILVDCQDFIDPKNDDMVNQESNDSTKVTVNMSNFQDNLTDDEIGLETNEVHPGILNDDINVIDDDVNQDIVKDKDAIDEMANISLPGDDALDDVEEEINVYKNVETNEEETKMNNEKKELNTDDIVREEACAGNQSSDDESLPLSALARNTRIIRPLDTAKLLEELYAKGGSCRQPPSGGALLTEEKLYCDMCPYQTLNVVRFLSHLKGHAATMSYKCNKCSYKTVNKLQLADHMTQHADAEQLADHMTQHVDAEQLADHMTQHADAEQLTDHMTQHADAGQLTDHMTQHAEAESYSCDVGNVALEKKCYLQRHVDEHCNKETPSKFILQKDLEIGPELFKCDICNKILINECNLRRHLLKHTSDRPYQCNVCDSSFGTKVKLQVHLKIHTRQMRYICDFCKKEFIRKGALETHLKLHADPSSLVSYTCNVCKRLFLKKGFLERHLKGHNIGKQYSCKYCKTAFARKSTLERHEKICWC